MNNERRPSMSVPPPPPESGDLPSINDLDNTDILFFASSSHENLEPGRISSAEQRISQGADAQTPGSPPASGVSSNHSIDGSTPPSYPYPTARANPLPSASPIPSTHPSPEPPASSDSRPVPMPFTDATLAHPGVPPEPLPTATLANPDVLPAPPPPTDATLANPNVPPMTRSDYGAMPSPAVAQPQPSFRADPISETTPISVPSPGHPASGLTIERLVLEAFDGNFSDIHLGVGEKPRFRDRGQMILSKHPVTDMETFDCWLQEILTPEQIHQFQTTLEFDGATQYEGVARVRINIFVSLNGPSIVMRLIPLKILTMEELSLPLVFQDLCHYHKGLILITGPTGSGKSTTLAAMVDYINREMPKHIISIEDPIEFVHQSRKSMIRQREVGIHTHQFDNALKASLREDPDVILIGEMRDRETVNTALKAAQTGHLVFGTLHTNSAVKTIERILNLYKPEEQAPMRMQVAESLIGVVAQSLVRTTDGKRAAVHEIMINTDAVKDYILRGDVEEIEALIPECTFDGMVTMNQCLYRLYEEGRIDEETTLEASPKPNEMAQILRGRV